jgi:carbon starvation protein
MTDARPIGYGGMLAEGMLGLLAVLAATAGFADADQWWSHYSSWGAANGLAAKLDAFVSGGATFVASLGIAKETAKTFMAVMVIAFAATSLDTGARIQRLVIAELAEAYGVKLLTNRFIAGALGIAAALLLAITQGGGKGGLALWPLFGTTNQLVAGVTLLLVSIWLQRHGRPVVYTLVPMLAVGSVTAWAMTGNLIDYYGNFEERWLLALSGTLILALDIWITIEGLVLLVRGRGKVAPAEPDAPFAPVAPVAPVGGA